MIEIAKQMIFVLHSWLSKIIRNSKIQQSLQHLDPLLPLLFLEVDEVGGSPHHPSFPIALFSVRVRPFNGGMVIRFFSFFFLVGPN